MDHAQEEINKALKLDPKYAEAYQLRGRLIHFKKEEKLKALDDLNQAIFHNPSLVSSFYHRGISKTDVATVYQKNQMLDKALEDCDQAIKLNPDYALAYSKKGSLMKIKGRLDEALDLYSKAIGLDKNCSNAFLHRALLFKEIRQLEKALKDYNQAIEINQNNPNAYFNRGVLLKEIGEYEQALQDYDRAIELNPTNASIYLNRGALLSSMNQKERALKDYDKAIQINPEYSNAYLNRALLLCDMDQIGKAVKDCNSIIKINKQDANAYFNRGFLFDQLDQRQQALDDYTQTIEINPKDSRAFINRGLLYWRMQEKEKAMKDCFTALEICPSNPLYLTIIGDLHFQDLQNEKVHQYFTEALKNIEGMQPEDKAKWGLSDKNISFIKIKLQILQEIERDIIIAKKQISLLPKISTQDQNQANEFFERIERIERSVSVIVLPNNESQKPERQQNMINQFYEMQQQLKQLQQQLQQQNQLINKIQNLDNFQIEFMMDELKKPRNKHQFIYYKSLFWRLYFYMHAMQELSTNLFQVNKEAFVESTSEKVASILQKIFKVGSKALEQLPIIGEAFNIINSALDFGIEYQKEAKFKRRIIRLTNIMKLFAITPSELEKEVQFAAIELSKLQEPGMKEIPISKFTQFVEKLSLLENTQEEYSRDPYWKKGTVDSLIILKYLEDNNDMIMLEDQHKKLRQVFIDAILKNENSTSNTIKKQEKQISKDKEEIDKCNIQ
ncbi:unnamed protein product (macronuclear) [Paramecium tetraurelia]|uniref:Uncharacterized protein n=1 Tax=Paramecium tetraurelia TaxID=5888 RepID=A0CJ33_PARTE|nr:uncharacterized protein GSPATT00007935001 [Paramecium tetraurelia]CAK70800.1 unnamed protein product [Paramecium tetraurelia]|eukprot:XP_001438197.1 hypothetical protein (macronuclear) [Paramecium tetraurelia strain d4-2]